MTTEISQTKYATYLRERQGIEVLENEFGFLTYKFFGDNCAIEDMFISSEFRNSGHGSKLISDLISIAQAGKCRTISGIVHMDVPHGQETLFAAMKTGFKVLRGDGPAITIYMEVKNG